MTDVKGRCPACHTAFKCIRNGPTGAQETCKHPWHDEENVALTSNPMNILREVELAIACGGAPQKIVERIRETVKPVETQPPASKTVTKQVEEGMRLRHAFVEEAGDKLSAARHMAYLSHLDRGELLAEVERLRSIINGKTFVTGDETKAERPVRFDLSRSDYDEWSMCPDGTGDYVRWEDVKQFFESSVVEPACNPCKQWDEDGLCVTCGTSMPMEEACDHPRSELLARKGGKFEMRKCLECTKIFRVRLRENGT